MKVISFKLQKGDCHEKEKNSNACGTGIATSTVVADKIADICKQEGIKAEYHNVR